MDKEEGLISETNLFQKPVKTNGFMNFLRQFVKDSRPTSDLDGARQVWNKMSEEEKDKFRDIDEGFYSPKSPSCPPPKKRSSCRLAKLKKKCCRKHKRPRRPKPKPRKRKPQCRSRPKPRRPRARCTNALATTLPNNGYLNFLRAYRRKHWNMKPNDLVMKAARAWCRMTDVKRDAYRRRIREMK